MDLELPARHLMDEVYQAPGQPRLRVALHYGEVHTRQRDIDLRMILVGGDATWVRLASSQSLSAGRSGQRNSSASSFCSARRWRTVPMAAASGDDHFNVSKKHTGEPDLWARLFRLES